ncbi:MAG: hypothetical protein R2722_09240 [Tessaracoccus sp.]
MAALVEIGIQKLNSGQDRLDLGADDQGSLKAAGAVVRGSASRLLVDVVRRSWDRLGFGIVDDEAFFQPRARPVGRADLETRQPPGDRRAWGYRFLTATLSTKHYADARTRRTASTSARRVSITWTGAGGDISLLLYDVTTLYFEAEKEDDLRKSGYSKEREG